MDRHPVVAAAEKPASELDGSLLGGFQVLLLSPPLPAPFGSRMEAYRAASCSPVSPPDKIDTGGGGSCRWVVGAAVGAGIGHGEGSGYFTLISDKAPPAARDSSEVTRS